MKKLFKMLLPMLVIGICFSSCTKEDIDTTPATPAVDNTEIIGGIVEKNDVGVFAYSSPSNCDCYGPFDAIDWENEDVAEVEAQIEAAIASMTEEELTALFTPVCTDDGGFYPNACFADCEGVTDYAECTFPEPDDTDWDTDWGCDGTNLDFLACYELDFPVTIAFSDGTTTQVNDMNEYLEAVLTIGNEPQLVYPINLTNIETQESATASNDEELAELAFDCVTGGGSGGGSGGGPGGGPVEWDDDCVVNYFPMTLYIDGEANTINNEEEFQTAIDEYMMNNPNGNLFLEIGFPMTLTFDSGDVVVVNSEEEWLNAMEENCP